MFCNVFDLLDHIKENNGIVILNKENLDDNKNSELLLTSQKIELIETCFFKQEFLVSGIHYSNGQQKKEKSQKVIRELKRLIVNEDDENLYLSGYELFFIPQGFRKLETFDKFEEMFLWTKEAQIKPTKVFVDFGYDSSPAKLVATVVSKDERYKEDFEKIEEKINHFLISDVVIKNWSNKTANNISVLTKLIGFSFPDDMLLEVNEMIEKTQKLIAERETEDEVPYKPKKMIRIEL